MAETKSEVFPELSHHHDKIW